MSRVTEYLLHDDAIDHAQEVVDMRAERAETADDEGRLPWRDLGGEAGGVGGMDFSLHGRGPTLVQRFCNHLRYDTIIFVDDAWR